MQVSFCCLLSCSTRHQSPCKVSHQIVMRSHWEVVKNCLQKVYKLLLFCCSQQSQFVSSSTRDFRIISNLSELATKLETFTFQRANEVQNNGWSLALCCRCCQKKYNNTWKELICFCSGKSRHITAVSLERPEVQTPMRFIVFSFAGQSLQLTIVPFGDVGLWVLCRWIFFRNRDKFRLPKVKQTWVRQKIF